MAKSAGTGRTRPAAARTPADANATGPFDTSKFIHTAQVGGIESYTIDEGPGRGVRALCFNTGAGLRYRVLVDRGLDIDHAFYNHLSLAFLTHKGVTAPTRGLDCGIGWLYGFPGGLLTSCGPFNAGPPGDDAGEELGLHGVHSNTAATVESVLQPDAHVGRSEMSVTGTVRYGRLFGPCVELRRTIRSALGRNAIDVTDEFTNAGNTPAPHAWLLHINFGYPLVDAGAELCYDSPKVEAKEKPAGVQRFRDGVDPKRVPEPLESHRAGNEAFAYLFPRSDRAGRATVAIVNRRRSLAVAIHYNTREFPRCGNWQHWGPGEYVTALEPMNCTVDGRWSDRERGLLDTIEPGGRKTYRYTLEVVTERGALEELRALNGRDRVRLRT